MSLRWVPKPMLWTTSRRSAARVFGAAVPERNPRTRTGRAVKLRSITDGGSLLPRSSVRVEYRYYWDTWDIRAHTAELGGSRYIGERFLVDAALRYPGSRRVAASAEYRHSARASDA